MRRSAPTHELQQGRATDPDGLAQRPPGQILLKPDLIQGGDFGRQHDSADSNHRIKALSSTLFPFDRAVTGYFSVMFDSVQALLKQAVATFPRQQDFAEAMGMSPQRVSRLLSGTDPYPTIDVRNCLRLAQMLRISPDGVLRTAGKQEVADLLLELYGPDRMAEADRIISALTRPDLLPAITALASIPDAARRPLEDLILLIANQVPQPSPESTPDTAPVSAQAKTPKRTSSQRRAGR